MGSSVKIGISSCLLGHRVRYDNVTREDPFVTGVLAGVFDFVPVCPEVEAGFSVPREAARLEDTSSGVRFCLAEGRKDMTDIMMKYTSARLLILETEGLSGFIFKTRSPSCAVKDAAVFRQDNSASSTGPGLFAACFIKHFPMVPVEDNEALHDRERFERFILSVIAYRKACGLKDDSELISQLHGIILLCHG